MSPRSTKIGRVRSKIVGALLVSLVTSLTPGLPFVPGMPVQFALAAGTTTRLSTSQSGGEANGDSAFTSVSADGRYVAFASTATNLVVGDNTGSFLLDVFVRDTAANQTTRVSVSSSGVEGNNTSTRPSISSDGTLVAFSSAASNLVGGDTNGAQDVFVHDRSTGATSRVSISSSGAQGNGSSFLPSLSSDGRYVAFVSTASNLVFGDTNGSQDAFVHDRTTGATTRVSVTTTGAQTDGPTFSARISGNGRYVAMGSEATNLVSGDTNGAHDVFLHDRETGSTTRVSVAADGSQANVGAQDAAISNDGAVVAFHSGSANLVAGDTNGVADVFVKYVASGAISRASVHSSGAEANGSNFLVAISGDGLVVAFESSASNLVDGDSNGRTDVFVRGLQSGVTSRASVSSADVQGNGNSTQAALSQDGRYIAFSSDATNLVESDTNAKTDVFLRDMQGGVVADYGSDKPHTFGIKPLFAYSTDPVNLATGVFTASAVDLVIPGRVLAFAFTRSYNSADDRGGPLGEGWTHSYAWTLADAGGTVELRRGDGSRETLTRNPDGTYADPPNVFDMLVKNGDGTFTLTLTSQVQYEFSTTGSLTRIHEPAGNQIVLAYTGANLTMVTDTVGRQVGLTYDGSNHLIQIQDPLGRKVTYGYDASGRLSTVTDKIGNAPGQNPALHRWTYGYGGTTRHITTITDPDGRVRVTNTYDGQGRVFEQRNGLNALTQIAYGQGQTVVTDPRLHATTYTFDSRMRVLTQVDIVGSNTYTITYVYDAQGNRTFVTDRNGKTTDITYDTRGNVLTKTDPEIDPQTTRYVTEFDYDTKNNLRLVTDARGFETTLIYETTSNVLLSVSRQIDATTNAVTKYEYTDATNPGLPTKVVAPRGNTGPNPNYAFATTLTYDAQGNLIQRIDPDGAKTTFAYDGAGRLSSFVDPDGYAPGAIPTEHTWMVGYDENDRETSRTDPLGNVLGYGYDGAGNRTTLTDRRGNITKYTYDLNTRLATVEQKPDPVVQPTLVYTTEVTTRDGNGNATRITQANGVVTDYTFDALDRLTSVKTYPDAQTTLTTSYVLDGNGQPRSRTTGDNVTVDYTYDALSRLSTVSGPALSITYDYDPTSQRTEMVDATGTTTYQYDGLGRVTQVAAPNGTLTYVYDLDGNRTTLGYPGSQNVTYAYSPGGRLNTVTDWASRVSTYAYKASGLVSTLTYPNTMLASYQYDRAQRLKEITNSVGATTITQHTYTLDAEGNRTALDEYVKGITPLVPTWSPSVQVNDVTTGQQDRPDIALGADGATYLIWDDYRTGGQPDIYFSRRDPATGAWSANQKVDDDTTNIQWNAAIAVDANNNAYAVWQDRRLGTIKNPDTDIFFSKRSAATGLWSANVRVNNDTSGRPSQLTPEIAVRSTGEAVSVWEDHRSNQWNVYSAKLAPGGSSWGANLRVTDNISSRKFTPDVAVGADGTAYAVWEDDRSGNAGIWFSTLPAGSSAWTANVKISDDPGTTAQYDPQIGISAAGDLLVIWQDDRVPNTEVRMRRRLAGQSNWQASIVASDAASIPVSLALGVRSDGNALAAWQDARGSSYDIWGADYTFATNSWSAPTLVSDDPGSTPQMRPAAALSSNELAIAWRDDRVSGALIPEAPAEIRARRRADTPGADHFAYAYDGLNRLVSSSGTIAESFVLDAATNIAARTGPSAAYTYDEANRRTSDGAQTLQWDDADRLVQHGAKTFVYDSLAHLTSFVDGSGPRAYAYDGDGLLISRTQNSVQTTYLWDASVTPARLILAGSDRLVYGFGPLYLVQASGTVTVARDGLGSVRAEVNDGAVVSRSLRYTAYGSLTASSTGAPTLLGYSGELSDNSGLLYLRARWYDPIMGMFTARDDVSGTPSAPVSLNGYSYAAGKPTGLTDPSGHCVPPPGGVGYCIERLIPTARSCNLFGILCGGGDARVGPDPSGGGYRVRQLIDGAGKITAQASPSTAFILGMPVGSSPGYLGTGSCAGFTDPTAVTASCVAYNGYGDATTLPWPIGSLAPPGPIQTAVQINVVDGRVVVSAQGTLYPSLEIWRYGPAGPQLVYFYNAIGVGQEGLGAPGNLPNNAGK